MRKNINTTNLTDTVQERMLKIELAIQFIVYDIWLSQNHLDSLSHRERRIMQKTFDDNLVNKLIEKKTLEDEYDILKFKKKNQKLNTFFDHPGAIFVLNRDTALGVKEQKEYREYLESQAEDAEEITLYVLKPMQNEKFTPARFLNSKKFSDDINLFEKITIKSARIITFDSQNFDCIVIN